MGKNVQEKKAEGGGGNSSSGQPQEIADLSDVEIEHVAGQCPGCLQKFGDQDQDSQVSLPMFSFFLKNET